MSSSQDLPYILPKDCDFAAIQAHDMDCRPKLVHGRSRFAGILINGPAEIIWPKGAERIICPAPDGARKVTTGPVRLVIPTIFRLPENTLNLDGDFGHWISYVVVDEATGKVFEGRWSRGSALRPKRIDGIPNDPQRITGGALNPDIAHICNLPIESAVYTVYATLANYKSNVLTVKVTVK